MPDVLVIGAGLAGLMTARRLVQSGFEPLVLEARERVGGRMLSHTVAGARFDLGAQWMGPGQTRLAALSSELGLRTFPTHHAGDKVLDLDGKLRRYGGSIPSIGLVNLVQTELMIRGIDRLARSVPLETPQQAPDAERLDRLTVEAYKQSLLGNAAGKQLLDAAVRTVFGAEPAELSLLYFLFYLCSGGGLRKLCEIQGGAQQDRFEAGAQTIAERVAADLGDRVELGVPVRTIEQRDGRVIARTDRGERSARFAVVAVPPHLAGRIDWQPALPGARAELCRRWPMGATCKVLAIYERARWRERGLSGEAVCPDGPLTVVFDNSSHDGRVAALLGFVVGDHARKWSRSAPEERKRTALAELERLLGAPARELCGYEEHDWAADPWSGGCPTAVMGPGVLTQLGPGLREPFGLVHWAGTEHARHGCGYLEGALDSADRAAAEVLGRLCAG